MADLREARRLYDEALAEAEGVVAEVESRYHAALVAYDADPTPENRAARSALHDECQEVRTAWRQEHFATRIAPDPSKHKLSPEGHVMGGHIYPTPPEDLANIKDEACAEEECRFAPAAHENNALGHPWKDPA